jgi:hypothetical protein
MASSSCRHPDIRDYDGIRCCLSCGNAILESLSSAGHVQDNDPYTPYRYRLLNYELGQEIRLIVLYMGRPDDPVICNIIHANLLDDPVFEAVSYTWATEDGDDSLSEVIHCLNNVIPVTPNCHAALRRFRETGRQRILWLDAICIDQSNVLERNHQVGLMDEIYSRATVVLIHIELSRRDYSRVFHLLERSSKSQKVDDNLTADVRDLFKLRWFTRVWVIQEVALARKAILAVGPISIELSVDVLVRLTKLCNQHMITVPGPLRWTPGQNNRLKILDCLSAARGSASKDPRDKVFAVLSLTHASIRSLVKIDYSASVEKVYLNVAIVSIMKQRHLGILAHVYLQNSKLSLPSWVPDWTVAASATISKLPYQFTRDTSLKPSMPLNQDYPSIVYGQIGWFGPPRGIEGDYSVYTQAGVCIEKGTSRHYLQNHHSSKQTNSGAYVETRFHILGSGISAKARVYSSPNPSSSAISEVPWISSLSVNLCRSPNLATKDPDHSSQMLLSSSVAEIVQLDNIPVSLGFETGPIKFYLRVRATYLDTIFQVLNEASASEYAKSAKSFDTLKKHWILHFFVQTGELLTIRSTALLMYPFPILTTKKEIPFYNIKALTSFHADAEKYGHSRRMFCTRYSVGFAENSFEAGDVVFAVDGATSPMILRSCGENQYKVVGECYLWAAAEKNYWSVGTESCPDQQRGSATFGKRDKDNEQWTGMIEIH